MMPAVTPAIVSLVILEKLSALPVSKFVYACAMAFFYLLRDAV